MYSLLLVCVLPLQSAREAAGALGTRRSPRPLWAEASSTPRALRVAGSKSSAELEVRHCEERKRRSNPDAVIPGWSAGPDPESRDSGFDASHRPGMTESGDGLLRFARNDGTGREKR